MGGGLEADLTQGAVPALWTGTAGEWSGWRPVLQVADASHVPDGTGLLLSDGVYSQHARLAPALNRLSSRGDDLRRGSVVRLQRFDAAPDPDHVRTILIFELKILQTECALIGSLKLYKPPRNFGVFSTSRQMGYDLSSDCVPCSGVQPKHIGYGPSCGSYPSVGDRLSAVALSEEPPVWKLVAQIKDEKLGYSDKPDLITVKAAISSVDPRLIVGYVACPLLVNGKRCNAKATRVDGMWRCMSCEHSFLQPSPSDFGWSICIQIQDHTGTTPATVCEEAVEEIFGCRGRDLYTLKYKEHDHAQLYDIINGTVCKQYVFQLKVERRSPRPAFSKVGRVECIVLKAEKVNPSAECHRLLGQIGTLLQEGSGPGSELRNPSMPIYTGSLDSRVCASVRRSSNSINSDHAGSPQPRALSVQQRLRGCAVSANEP